jgi:hypothetical protein
MIGIHTAFPSENFSRTEPKCLLAFIYMTAFIPPQVIFIDAEEPFIIVA